MGCILPHEVKKVKEVKEPAEDVQASPSGSEKRIIDLYCQHLSQSYLIHNNFLLHIFQVEMENMDL